MSTNVLSILFYFFATYHMTFGTLYTEEYGDLKGTDFCSQQDATLRYTNMCMEVANQNNIKNYNFNRLKNLSCTAYTITLVSRSDHTKKTEFNENLLPCLFKTSGGQKLAEKYLGRGIDVNDVFMYEYDENTAELIPDGNLMDFLVTVP